jgi:hypothetical protein
MGEGEKITGKAPADDAPLAAENSFLGSPLTSSERRELIKLELMKELNERLWTVLGRVIVSLTLVMALVTGLGYFGITAYIQSIFKDKLEEATKNFDKLRDDIGRQQAYVYADEKIFISLLERYDRDKQILNEKASIAIEQINRSEILKAENMVETKKFMINNFQKMATLSLSPSDYRKFENEIEQKDMFAILPTPLDPLGHLLFLYAHVVSLDLALRRSIDRFVEKEKTDEEAKAILQKEFETFYSIYRKQFNAFENKTFSMAHYDWSMLTADVDSLFIALNPWGIWLEKQTSP